MNRLTEHRRLQLTYLIADILSAEVVWMLFLLFRWMVYEGHVFGMQEVLIPMFNFYRPLLLYPIGCVLVYYLSGYYLRPQTKKVSTTLAYSFISALVISIAAFFIIIVDDPVNDYRHYYGSFLVLLSLQFVVSSLFRVVINLWTNTHIRETVFTITANTDEQFEQLLAAMPVNRVHIDLPASTSNRQLYDLIARIYPLKTQISLPPRTFDLMSGAARIVDLKGAPIILITAHKMSDTQLCIKRAFDVVTSALGLILLSPLFLLLAILVVTTSKGKAIYSQERIGLYGKPFKIYKFRTMVDDAEDNLPRLTDVNDSRITKVGHWLRKYRLDELPQLWNVLRGDMSIVGPRPERDYFIQQIMLEAPYYCLLYRIRPGLTSWGPIKVGYTDTTAKMIERLDYDIAYMENMSLILDLKIMFYTLRVLFNGEGQ